MEINQWYIFYKKIPFNCLQSLMVRPLHLPWIHRWQIPHLTASSQLAINFWHMPQVNVWLCDTPYETNRSAADLQQICFTKNRLAADYFIVCKVCFQSVEDALPSSSAKMFSCRRETDEKQICTWSVKSAESASCL